MADFDISAARAAGYTDGEIEQYLAMSGRAPKDARAMLGRPAIADVAGALTSGFRRLIGTEEPGPAQAMTRVTHTPVRWGEPGDGAYGIYNPASAAITMDATRLPQSNGDAALMSNVLRHEQVHALLPADVVQQIEAYFTAHPELAATGRANLARYDTTAAATNRGLATEAPAYAVQGYRFGMPDETVEQYSTRMSPDQQKKYAQLLRSR